MRRLWLIGATLVFLTGNLAAEGTPRRKFPMAPGATVQRGLTARPETWGSNTSILRIPASAFLPTYQDGTVQWGYEGMARWLVAGDSDFAAPVQLPPGAKVLGLELDGVDNNASRDLSALFLAGSALDGSGLNYGGPSTSGAPGQQTVYYDLSSEGLVIDNVNSIYEIDVSFDVSDANDLLLASVAVYYQLQVSAPGAQVFGDVPPSHPFFQFIQALSASGITGGCGGGNFCPNNYVTRGQMAVFLAKALGLYFE